MMPRKVTHQQIYKPGFGGGVTNTTLCGAVDNRQWVQNDGANVGPDVTCKNCLRILESSTPNYRKQWVGKSYDEVEAASASRA